MQFKDLPPQKDPKGGSPKSPLPMKLSDLTNIQNPVNGSVFWRITLGNVATIVTVVASVVYAAGKINERIDALWNWKTTVEQRFEHYDDVGTKALKSHTDVELLKQIEQDRRINNVEKQLDSVVPDVREIKTKIDIVSNLLEEEKRLKR